MAKPSSIEKYKLQKVVAAAATEGKSLRDIAEICSKHAKQKITHVAVDRYLKSIGDPGDQDEQDDPPPKKEAVVRQPRVIEKIIERDLDIISLQYRTTTVLLDRFETIAEAPNSFEQRMEKVIAELRENGDETTSLEAWSKALADDLRRNVQSVATLNRELRENSKFLMDLREKAFQFELWKEFVDLFVDHFRTESPEACERALHKISGNPRMQRIIEMQVRGEMVG